MPVPAGLRASDGAMPPLALWFAVGVNPKKFVLCEIYSAGWPERPPLWISIEVLLCKSIAKNGQITKKIVPLDGKLAFFVPIKAVVEKSKAVGRISKGVEEISKALEIPTKGVGFFFTPLESFFKGVGGKSKALEIPVKPLGFFSKAVVGKSKGLENLAKGLDFSSKPLDFPRAAFNFGRSVLKASKSTSKNEKTHIFF